MDDLNLTVRISDSRSLCIAPISSQMYRETGAKGLGGEYGYFIFEVDDEFSDSGINIIGKAASADAALRLFELLGGKAV
ncbi:hypothetical protein RZS28_05430 [Methylocapsa polymorpha]|uniref:Uncharacterized protein n=1 Tax=Methylocapsa polymorpha TaxID=3080828 RepID=A0ABZ0HTW7_9HYPH|nr:hypothetical protein RZS28_05430 [Methylocapsa sp. RX1]